MDRIGKKQKRKQRLKKPKLERSKLDTEIAKYLRFTVPRKSTMFQKQPVEYFVGSKAVDILMESDWASGKKKKEKIFHVRDDAVGFLDSLQQKQFFYRVLKTEHEKKNKDAKTDEENPAVNEAVEDISKVKRRKNKKDSGNEEEKEESSKTKGKKKKKEDEKKEKEKKEKVKKRYKLTYHEEQVFCDSKDVYIWVYNPASWKTIAKGIAMMVFVAMATLFPLWPDQVRVGVYYLSVTAGVFIGSVFAVAFIRTILFGFLWLITGGKHHLWILPNLLEDVGFFESFKPFYSYEYKGPVVEDDEDEEDSEGDEDSAGDDVNTEEKNEDIQCENISDNDALEKEKLS